VRLIIAQQTAVLCFDANDTIHYRELTHRIRNSLSEKTAIPFTLTLPKDAEYRTRTSHWLSLYNQSGSNFSIAIAASSSRHASTPPTENQGDYEQQQEHEEQHFGDAGGRCGDTAKSKDRCHKRNNQENYSPT
jgi:hypothetical protein